MLRFGLIACSALCFVPAAFSRRGTFALAARESVAVAAAGMPTGWTGGNSIGAPSRAGAGAAGSDAATDSGACACTADVVPGAATATGKGGAAGNGSGFGIGFGSARTGGGTSIFAIGTGV